MLNQILTYGGIGLGIVFVILFIVAITGDKKRVTSILGPVGLALVGIVIALGLRKNDDGDLEKIREENDRIRKELADTKARREALERELVEVKDKFENRIATLEKDIAAKDAELEDALEKMLETVKKSPREWLDSLPADKRDEILNKIRNEIDFG